MSRSYKKYPCFKDNSNPHTKKYIKRQFNKRIRKWNKEWENPISENNYKKHNESWDICDWTYQIDSNEENFYKSRIK